MHWLAAREISWNWLSRVYKSEEEIYPQISQIAQIIKRKTILISVC